MAEGLTEARWVVVVGMIYAGHDDLTSGTESAAF